MSKKIPIIIVASIGSVSLALYVAYYFHSRHQPLEWSGTVETKTITVGSLVGGRVKSVHVAEGDAVKANDVLVTLEPGDLLAQRLGTLATLSKAEAEFEKLKNGALPEQIAEVTDQAIAARAAAHEAIAGPRQEEIATARDRLQEAETNLKRVQRQMDRSTSLRNDELESQSQYDDVSAALQTATSQRDAAQQALDLLLQGTRREERQQAVAKANAALAQEKFVKHGARIEDLKTGQAEVSAAKARLEQLDVAISELTIRAPVDAQVESVDLRPGDLLQKGVGAVTLLEADQLYVRIYIPETQLGVAHVGQVVPIYSDSFPNQPVKGVISFISSEGEYTPRNLQTVDDRAYHLFRAKVTITQGAQRLRAGMAVTARVQQ